MTICRSEGNKMKVKMNHGQNTEEYIVVPYNCFYCQYYKGIDKPICLRDGHVIYDIKTCEEIKRQLRYGY